VISGVGAGVGVSGRTGVGVCVSSTSDGVSAGLTSGVGEGGLTQAPSKTTPIVRVIRRVFVLIIFIISGDVMQFSMTKLSFQTTRIDS
jgi:hypothetical protein